ncbi:MAG: hypothetical protein RIS52_2051 [Pseudomonadota bacterium]
MTSEREALFSVQGTPALPDHPALIGGKCASCGHIFFPFQAYGCEKCGSIAIESIQLSGRGKLICSAQVHMSANPAFPAPYVVGSIQTEDGAVVRAVLSVTADADLVPGTSMITELVPETRPEQGGHDIRFKPAAKEA